MHICIIMPVPDIANTPRVAAIATIIYAAVRHRRVMNRSYTLDVKHYGFSDEHEAKRLSDASSRRTSYASALRLSHVQPPPPAVYDTVPADEGATAGAYSHERNTDFDEYMARRQSVDTEGGGWRSRASSAGSQSLAAALAADRSEYVDVVLHPGGGGGSRRSSASTVRPAPGDRALHAVPEDTSSSTYSNDATESVLYQSPSRDANKDAAESLLGNRRASYEDCVVSSLPERIVVSPPVPPVQPGMYTSEPEWMRK